MKYIYLLENKKNGKIFVGKSSLPKWVLIALLFDILNSGKHYNKLLQRDWGKNDFSIKFEYPEDVGKTCDKYIKDKNLLNPKYGYNVYADLKNNRGRCKKDDVFSDDLCLVFCWYPSVQYIVRTFDLERNTVSNRLANFELFENDYFARKIARYDDYNYTSMRLLYLNGEGLTANQIMDKMMHRYDVSNMLRITPRKISSFYSVNHVQSKKDKSQGCLIFYPEEKDDKRKTESNS